MSTALTSNSFRVGAGLRPKPDARRSHADSRPPFPVVMARQGGGAPDAETAAPKKTPAPPFFVDFGKNIADAKSLIPAVTAPSAASLLVARRRKDPQTVFVAGAAGQAGVRISQTLLRRGYTVRAGVPDLASAQELARTAAAYKIISPAESRRLNAVESSFEDPEAIAKAIGPANKVVVTIGPSEKGPSGEVSTDEALRVVRAADLAGVGHVVVVYDGASFLTGQSTYNVLDGITSFFSNLFARTQSLTLSEFLTEVADTGVSYTLVKAVLTEDYAPENSYALVVSQEGSSTTTDQSAKGVTKSQIAAFVADVFDNTSAAENKVVEASTSLSASSKSVAELLSAIPEDGRRQDLREARAKAEANQEASGDASSTTKSKSKLMQGRRRRVGDDEEEDGGDAEGGAVRQLEGLVSQAKRLGGDFSWEKLSSQFAKARNEAEDDPRAQIATVRGQAKAQKLPPKRAIVRPPASKVKTPSTEATKPKPELRKVFGLFQQETIFVDDE